MYFNIIIPVLINLCILNYKYTSLINCIIITLSSLLKILFYNNELIHIILQISTLISVLYYFIDTIKLLYNKLINIFILHHICSIYIFTSTYIFDYDIYLTYILLFLMEFSSVIYNLYIYKFIKFKTHIILYIPLRFISNLLFIYFIIYEIKYTYFIEFIFNIITYLLLFIFNTGGILKCLKII